MIYKCPRCGAYALCWDARCRILLCLGRGCHHHVRPPCDPILITTGRVEVLQGWIDTQKG